MSPLVVVLIAGAVACTALAGCCLVVMLRRRARRRWLNSLSPRERAVEIAFEHGRWLSRHQQRLRKRPTGNSDGDGTLGETWTTGGW